MPLDLRPRHPLVWCTMWVVAVGCCLLTIQTGSGIFLIPTFYLLSRLLHSEGPELADSSAPSDYVNSTAVPLSPSGNHDPLWDKWLDG